MTTDTPCCPWVLVSPQGRGLWVRVRGLAVAGPMTAVVVLALAMAPSPAGHGTHRQLGLPACGFMASSGYPCPSCGMTTSMTAMAHGRVDLAIQAQPMGLMLFPMVVLFGALGLWEAVSGRSQLWRIRPGPWIAYTIVAGLFVGWGVKLAVGIAGGQYPTH